MVDRTSENDKIVIQQLVNIVERAIEQYPYNSEWQKFLTIRKDAYKTVLEALDDDNFYKTLLQHAQKEV